MTNPEPRNPFYMLLLLASLAFAITAVAYAVIPTLEDKATDLGQAPPASQLRALLRQQGWKWLLYELGAMVVLGLLSMGLDRLRSLKNARSAGTIPPDTTQRPPV